MWTVRRAAKGAVAQSRWEMRTFAIFALVRAVAQLGQTSKTRQKIDWKIREIACNSLTNYEYEAHAMTGNGRYVKIACEKLWKHFGWTYFGRVLARWNHSVSEAPYPSLNGDCFGYEVFPFPFHIVPFGPSFKHLHVKGKMGIFWSSTFSSSTEPKCTRFAASFGSNFVPFFSVW